MADRRAGHAIRLDDGTTWAAPDDPAHVQWIMRYGTADEKRAVELSAASLIASYAALCFATARRRAEVVRRMRAVMKREPKETSNG